jgi:hypothetical protein
MTKQKKQRIRRKKINAKEVINNPIISVENDEDDNTKKAGMREEQTR